MLSSQRMHETPTQRLEIIVGTKQHLQPSLLQFALRFAEAEFTQHDVE
jgi:hypothetical protein